MLGITLRGKTEYTHVSISHSCLTITGVPCGCEGDDATVAGREATEGGAEPCEGGCCWSSLSFESDASPALIDSIMASTSSAVGNSFNVGDGTRPVERFSTFD